MTVSTQWFTWRRIRSAMRISIVTPAWNEGGRIGRAVRSAIENGALDVIVVDGGSEDHTRAEAADAGAIVIDSPRGRAKQQNAGAEVARGEVLLFLHADNWLAPGALEQVLAAFADPSVLVAAFRQRIEAAGCAYRLLEWGNAARVRWRAMAYGDQGICIRRATFERCGGFPSVGLMEDVLLMRAVRRLGRPVLLPGPLYVDARRWRRHGVVRQTLRNWSLLAAERCGVAPDRLAGWYRPHVLSAKETRQEQQP